VIAVTGATGALGRRVADRLAATGADLRPVVREHERRLRQHFAAVDAAVAAGVQRIVSGRTTLPLTPRKLGAGP